MSKLSTADKSFLSLLLRSDDLGDGWRRVSSAVWTLVDEFPHKKLIQTWPAQQKVRLTRTGKVVVEYLL